MKGEDGVSGGCRTGVRGGGGCGGGRLALAGTSRRWSTSALGAPMCHGPPGSNPAGGDAVVVEVLEVARGVG